MSAESFGPYRILELLGRGGMGEVHRALDTAHDRVVALKRLSGAYNDDSDFRARFRRESQIVARLREPHVIPIHAFGEIEGRLYLDMRLVEGHDLARVLAHGPIEPRRAVRIIEQVAGALDAAHVDNLVHRDVKPSNVLVSAGDFVYLVDFGIARSLSTTATHLTASGDVVGTLDYMAPERFNPGPLDGRVDVYALACVLFACLTGRRPFNADGTAAQIWAHMQEPPPRPSSVNPMVPRAFDDVVVKGMAKDPDRRYQTAGALASAAALALEQSRPVLPAPPTRGWWPTLVAPPEMRPPYGAPMPPGYQQPGPPAFGTPGFGPGGAPGVRPGGPGVPPAAGPGTPAAGVPVDGGTPVERVSAPGVPAAGAAPVASDVPTVGAPADGGTSGGTPGSSEESTAVAEPREIDTSSGGIAPGDAPSVGSPEVSPDAAPVVESRSGSSSGSAVVGGLDGSSAASGVPVAGGPPGSDVPVGGTPVGDPPGSAVAADEVRSSGSAEGSAVGGGPVAGRAPTEEIVPGVGTPAVGSTGVSADSEVGSSAGGAVAATGTPAGTPEAGATPVETPVPVADAPAAEVPVVGIPAGEAPVVGSPMAGTPVAGRSVAGVAAPGTPAAGIPVVGGVPVPGTPVAGTPVVGRPVDGAPVAGSPVAGRPVASGASVPGTPAAGIPVVGQPVGGTPVAGQPVVGVPVPGTPAAGIPVVGRPVVGGGSASGAPAVAQPVVGGTPARGVPVPGTPAGGVRGVPGNLGGSSLPPTRLGGPSHPSLGGNSLPPTPLAVTGPHPAPAWAGAGGGQGWFAANRALVVSVSIAVVVMVGVVATVLASRGSGQQGPGPSSATAASTTTEDVPPTSGGADPESVQRLRALLPYVYSGNTTCKETTTQAGAEASISCAKANRVHPQLPAPDEAVFHLFASRGKQDEFFLDVMSGNNIPRNDAQGGCKPQELTPHYAAYSRTTDGPLDGDYKTCFVKDGRGQVWWSDSKTLTVGVLRSSSATGGLALERLYQWWDGMILADM
ncbi:hypothetical protein GCM10022243_10370 [Saccharothrix violaceirubra]|uniref:non-specific serine/threonine protein kinase n=1 Tax=Saccharothrix violaceirubra TaxID=413306 RepID=A0A7W7WX05_9PSEU|nr:serine/threonine protein kinase [Saccharothrix violaceirubra]MBB4966123.1 tRNA A-37 threonylcarbamoyl transferase component Bud32 [Saccharothrix violaceirubra]